MMPAPLFSNQINRARSVNVNYSNMYYQACSWLSTESSQGRFVIFVAVEPSIGWRENVHTS